jgi:thiol-disulfide isomerase/thioredoxin
LKTRLSTIIIMLLVLGQIGWLAGCGRGSSDTASQVSGEQSTTSAGSSAAANAGDAAAKAAEDRTVGGRPGNLAPDFALTDLNGHVVRLHELRGNVVLVDFWATWCGPCKLALPHLEEIHETYGDKGVTIVAIAMDQSGAKVVKPFVEKTKLGFKVVLPADDIDRKFGGILGLPTTFIIGPDGTVYKKYVGYQRKEVFLRDIMALKPELSS